MPEADQPASDLAARYRPDRPARQESFFLKGSNDLDWGLKNRLSRIFDPDSGRTVMLAIDHGKPKLLSLKEAIACYIEHRREVVLRRTAFDLARARERAHILEGYLIALDHLDEVIALKLLKQDLVEDQLIVARFIYEIKLARRISHPNVIRIHDF